MRISIESTPAVQNDCRFPARSDVPNKGSTLNLILASHSMAALESFLRFESGDPTGD
jgi:hypothetical protein